jgi:hypothetical protein
MRNFLQEDYKNGILQSTKSFSKIVISSRLLEILPSYWLSKLCECLSNTTISHWSLNRYISGKHMKNNLKNSYKWSIKVKLSLCFNWEPRLEDVLGEWRYSSTYTLTSALDGGEWSASCHGRFTPLPERASGTHWAGGCMGTTVGLDPVVKRKIPSPCRDSKPRSSSP